MNKSQEFTLTPTDRIKSRPTHIKSDIDSRVGATATEFDKWLTRKLLGAIGFPNISIQLWNDETVKQHEETSVATVIVKSRAALLKLIIDPEYYFGELFSSGEIEVEGDLHACLEAIYRTIRSSHNYFFLNTLKKYRRRKNSPKHALLNIHQHYDISNMFYQAWLDNAAMQYTCAYFESPDMTLEQAQLAKMHHICRKLELKPGQTVVEAGCGWGGFARFMAQEYGVNVKAYNISHEQLSYANEQIRKSDVSDKVEYIEDDYRNITGKYDVFVSVGMLEHIGIEYYHQLGAVINSCLNEQGRGLIHTIGRNEPGLLNAWIESRIFPGACPPSLGQMMQIFEPYSFSILDIENLRLHYAKTLDHWLQRFESNQDEIQKMYDEAFIRAWYLYLTGSKAAFTSGTMQLFQVLFTRPHNNDLTWSRSHLYSR
jgi:cyclopropane-fatty-acyl-phospholipid synthase